MKNVESAFMKNGRDFSILDPQGKFHINLFCQQKGYKKTDKPVKHEKSLLPIAYRLYLKSENLSAENARYHILTGTLFFAMRICKYLFLSPQDRRIKSVRIKDITFMVSPQVILHSDPLLHKSESVLTKF